MNQESKQTTPEPAQSAETVGASVFHVEPPLVEAIAYTTKTGATRYKARITAEFFAQMQFDGGYGFCTNCGELAEGDIEPDARNYACEACNAKKVSGVEELLMMGVIEIAE